MPIVSNLANTGIQMMTGHVKYPGVFKNEVVVPVITTQIFLKLHTLSLSINAHTL